MVKKKITKKKVTSKQDSKKIKSKEPSQSKLFTKVYPTSIDETPGTYHKSERGRLIQKIIQSK